MKQGIYLYAPSGFMKRIKEYVTKNYTTVDIYGTSEISFFVSDFFKSHTHRNLKEVVIICTRKMSDEVNKEMGVIKAQIEAIQSIREDNLIVTLLYTDPKVIDVFRNLGVNTVLIKADSINNDVIEKIILAPVLKGTQNYMEQVEPNRIKINSVEENRREAVKSDVINVDTVKNVDVYKQFESNLGFTDTLRVVHEDLKDIELRMDVDDWTHQELQGILEQMDTDFSPRALDKAISTHTTKHIQGIKDRIRETEKEIAKHDESYKKVQKEDTSNHLNNLAIYKDGLKNAVELSEIQSKSTLYSALQKQLVADGDKSLKGFKEKLKDIEELTKLKDSEKKIELLKSKRKELLTDLHHTTTTFNNRYKILDNEYSTQQQLLVSRMTSEREDLSKMLGQIQEVGADDKLVAQFNIDKQSVEILADEVRLNQEDRKALTARVVSTIRDLRNMNIQLDQIVNLDTTIIKEYDKFTEKLKSTKKIELVVEDYLATKLETVAGVDGVGKTTVAVNYATTLINKGRTVCLIDLDTDTPQLKYFADSFGGYEELADFVNTENTVDALAQLKTVNGSLIVVNNYSDNSILFQANDCEDMKSLYFKVLDRLELLARAFDYIVVIAPLELDLPVDKLYEESGKFFYVVDLDPSTLEQTGVILDYLNKKIPKKYFKLIINKYVDTDISKVKDKMGLTMTLTPYTVQLTQQLITAKFTNKIYSQTAQTSRLFDFK